MLLASLSVLAIGIARVRIWRVAPESHRLTAAMFAIATAALLYLPCIGERHIDPRNLLGANTSDFLQHLLTVAGCYALAAAAIDNSGYRWLWLWRGFVIAVVTALVATYFAGPGFRHPGEEFGLMGPVGYAHAATLVGCMLVTFTIITVTAPAAFGDTGFHEHISLLAVFAVGVLGLGCNLLVGTLMLVDPDFVVANYTQLAASWTIPALIALAIAGLLGLAGAWGRRHDPV